LVGTTVTAKVKDTSGNEHEINITYGGIALIYIANPDTGEGGLIAITNDANQTQVFKVSGDAVSGTYKVTMIEALDAITTTTQTQTFTDTMTMNTSGATSDNGINVSLSTNNGNIRLDGSNLGVNHSDSGTNRYEIEGNDKLIMTFSSPDANSDINVTQVNMTLNRFGDTNPDWLIFQILMAMNNL
jgi:hypothetical protein